MDASTEQTATASPTHDAGTSTGGNDGAAEAPASMGQSWSMREAAEACGVSLDTIKRRRRDGSFPNSAMIDGAWRIPSTDLAKVAAAEGWTLMLGHDDEAVPLAEHEATSDAEPQAEHLVRVAVLEAQLEHQAEMHGAELGVQGGTVSRLTAERDRARSDLEQERAELVRVRAELADAEKRAAVGEALADERAGRLGHATEEAVELRARADAAEAALGWGGRRRLRRNR